MDSIIFDLDGTLWDSTDVVGIMGLQVKEAGRKLFPDVDEDTQQKILKECSDVECHHLAEQGGML